MKNVRELIFYVLFCLILACMVGCSNNANEPSFPISPEQGDMGKPNELPIVPFE